MAIHSRCLNNYSVKIDTDTGATLVEAAISVSLFIVLALVIVDIARYFLIYIVLNFATQSALDLAMKIPVEVYTSSTNCGGPWPTACDKYKERINRVLQRALDISTHVVTPSGVPSMAQAESFEHYDPTRYAPYSSALEMIRSDAIFLRPGEAVVRTGSDETVDHPSRPFGTAAGQGWPHGAGETWASVLDHDPLVVMMRVKFTPITPLFPKMTVTSRQIGYRKVKDFGGASRGDGSPPAISPSATPTPAPTPPPQSYDCSCCVQRAVAPCTVVDCVNQACINVGR